MARRIDYSRPVEVYRNLRKRGGHGRWYSVRQNGLVVGHRQELALADVTFHVGKAGRERVRRTGRKNVHAWIRGRLLKRVPGGDLTAKRFRGVWYDPFSFDHFYDRDLSEVVGAKLAVINGAGTAIFARDISYGAVQP